MVWAFDAMGIAKPRQPPSGMTAARGRPPHRPPVPRERTGARTSTGSPFLPFRVSEAAAGGMGGKLHGPETRGPGIDDRSTERAQRGKRKRWLRQILGRQ